MRYGISGSIKHTSERENTALSDETLESFSFRCQIDLLVSMGEVRIGIYFRL